MKIIITVTDENTIVRAEALSFESAQESLGKLERFINKKNEELNLSEVEIKLK